MTPEQKEALQRAALARAKAKKSPSVGEKIGTLLNMGGEALTLGLVGDEASAKFDELIGRGTYDERLGKYRADEERMREDHPVISLAAEVAPAMLLPANAAAKGATMGAKALRGGIAAGAAGGVYGFMEGEGGPSERLKNAALVGGMSAPLGAASPYAARGIERYLDKRAGKKLTAAAIKNAPDNEQLRGLASAAYKNADQVPLPRAGLAQAAQDAATEISPYRGINPQLMPKTAGVMNELTDIATAPSPTIPFGEVDEVRQLANVPRADFMNPKEQRGGAVIANAIDNFIEQADPKTSKEVTKARDMWSRLRKSEMIEDAIEKASKQASGFENGLRVQFRAILNNKKKAKSLSKAEIAAMEEVTKGTTVGNWMKKLGKLGFGRGQQSNVLSGTAGTAVFGPGSIAAGQLGSKLSESITGANAARAAGLIRAGGMPSPVTMAQVAPQLPGLLQHGLQSLAPRAMESLSNYMPR